jgi:hypothetical protein
VVSGQNIMQSSMDMVNYKSNNSTGMSFFKGNNTQKIIFDAQKPKPQVQRKSSSTGRQGVG